MAVILLGLLGLRVPGAWAQTVVEANASATTTDATVTTTNTTLQALRTASGTSSGSANENGGFFSVAIPSGHGSSIPYEVNALYSRCQTADNNPSAPNPYDCAGSEAQALTNTGCTLCRVFGAHGDVTIFSGQDAFGVGGEFEVVNGGSDQSQINQNTTKIASHATCIGAVNCTVAFSATASGVANPKFHMVFEATQAEVSNADCFLCLLSGSSVASMISGTYGDGHTIAKGNANVIGPASTTRLTQYQTGTTGGSLALRWVEGANQNAESGGNAGSDFVICRDTDAGALIDCPVSITRSTGTTTFVQSAAFTASTFFAAPLLLNSSVLISPTAPTITSGFGTSPTLPQTNGTGAFTVKIGTGGAATSGVLAMPTATNGWACYVNDLTHPGANFTKVSATGTNSLTLTNYNSAGTATAWTANDVLQAQCAAY